MDESEFQQLLDWVEQRLNADEAAATAAVVATDSRARGVVTWLLDFIETGRRMPIAKPPSSVRRELRQAFHHWSEQRRTGVPGLHVCWAELVFDSRRREDLAGVRAADRDDRTTHLAFSSERLDVVVDIRPAGHRRAWIEGQVLTADGADHNEIHLTIIHGDDVVGVSGVDDLGRFVVADVPAAPLELRFVDRAADVRALVDLSGRDVAGD